MIPSTAESEAYRLGIRQLAGDDDVGVLARGNREALLERRDVQADFHLRHQPTLVGVHIFDRRLHRHDLLVRARVDQINHRRQRRALAAANRSDDQD
jgi:hypothetical protein